MRAYTLGNGSYLVGVDSVGQVRDLYYPRVGRENHVAGRTHRIGIFVDGALRWTDDPDWRVSARAHPDALAGGIDARSSTLNVRLTTRDLVYNEKNIFLREVSITNVAGSARKIALFFGQEFQVGETGRGDTAYYDPRCKAIVHYEGSRMFLIRAESADGKLFDQWSVGLNGIEGRDGTYRDAEDGELSMNGIEHGQVDSVMRLSAEYAAGETRTFYYWIAAGEYFRDIYALNQYVLDKTPQHLMETTTDYWKIWLKRQGIKFTGLPQNVIDMFHRSLLVVRAHEDKGGSIIASSDTGILNQGRDTYAYMWPRDAAYAARALILSGETESAKRFFQFCNSIISDDGYFMHKYLPDGSIGSSWHPWVRKGNTELPIQADETAIVLVVLKEYYHISRDIEFIEEIFNSLIKKAGDFLMKHIDAKTGLPLPSYDLWEEVYGVSTYTASATYGALRAAEYFADLLGKRQLAGSYRDSAEKMQEAIVTHLYNGARKAFHKTAFPGETGLTFDDTLDFSSTFGVYEFGVLSQDDPRLSSSFNTMEKELEVKGGCGGMPRNEKDAYYRTAPDAPPNPWSVTTLWKAQYLIHAARRAEDLPRVEAILRWAVEHAAESGMMSEQLHPVTGAILGATPLVWSHAEFVTTVIEYLQKADDLGVCNVCYPIRRR